MKRLMGFGLSVLLLILLTAPAGGAQGPPQQDQAVREPRLREIVELVNLLVRAEQGRGGGRGPLEAVRIDALRGGVAGNTQTSGAWWTNTAVVQRLGLSDDQKARD